MWGIEITLPDLFPAFMPINKLSDNQLRTLKWDGKDFKKHDGAGLFLQVTKSGKYWIHRTQFRGKAHYLSYGNYPLVSLADARGKRGQTKLNTGAGIAPDAEPGSNNEPKPIFTFRDAAREWESRDGIDWRQSHRKNVTHRLKNYVFPIVGDLAPVEVKPKHIRDILDSATAGGHYETARKLRQYISQICRAATIADHIDTDPAQPLIGYVKRRKEPQSYAHTTDRQQLAGILRTIDSYPRGTPTAFALKIAPHVFVRPAELRGARWVELDLDAGRWIIPASRMKKTSNGNHVVPLSHQVVELFKELQKSTGCAALCFPGMRDVKRPISDNTLAAALRRIDIPKEQQSIHGWRHCASTLLNETGGFNPDLIEIQLHRKRS